MANQWFRLYAEFATDPKVQMLSEAMQRRYVMLLCLRCSNGDVTLQDEEVAFQLRITPEELSDTKDLFISKGLVDKDWSIAGWEKRQYVSDSSTTRVAAHREKKKRGCNVTVTPPDTDTDTETDKTSSEADASSPAAPTVPHRAIIDLYNEVLGSQGLTLVKPALWKGSRETNLRARWREAENRQSLDWWRGWFEYIAESDFLMGKASNQRPFRADLEWLVTFKNFAKVCEGKYHG